MQETAQQYTQRLLGSVEGKEPLRVQKETAKKLTGLIRGLNKKQLTRKPAPGKWSISEILAHLADAEIVGSWRLRQVICSNGSAIQAYDQDVWASTFNYARRDARQSLEFFRALRENNLAMLKGVPEPLWENYGEHQERGRETVAHIVRMFAGHDLNHLGQVERIVKDLRSKK